MSTTPKSIAIHIFLIVCALYSYDILQFMAINILFIVFPENSVFLNSDVFIDTIACLLQLCFYLGLLYYLHQKHFFEQSPFTPTSIHTPRYSKKWFYLSTPFIAFGLSGLSSLWLTSAEKYLVHFPFIGDSFSSFENTWQGIENEPYLFTFCSLVLLGPLVEELLFRGIVYNTLKNLRSGWYPIIFSSVLFGLWHMEFVQSVYTTLIAIGIGIVYYYTDDLRYPILIHIFNNLYSTLPPFLDNDRTYEIINTISFICILPTIFMLYYLVKKRPVK